MSRHTRFVLYTYTHVQYREEREGLAYNVRIWREGGRERKERGEGGRIGRKKAERDGREEREKEGRGKERGRRKRGRDRGRGTNSISVQVLYESIFELFCCLGDGFRWQ